MNSHKNARLTAKGRAHLVEQIALVGLPEAACRAGISTRRARMWQQRAAERPDALTDRSSRPHASPRTIPCDKRERIVNLRRNHRLTYAVIAGRLGVSIATVGRVSAQAGLAKLPPLASSPSHATSVERSRSSGQSIQSLPTARDIRHGAPAPCGRPVRALRGDTCG